MRSIDKGLLLAEYFDVDAYGGVSSLISWIKESKQYQLFLKRKKELRLRSGWKARRIYYYYDKIDLNSIRSIEDGLVVYGQINYLIRVSIPSFYSNPFMIEYLEDRHMKVGDFIITFDGKRMSLNDFVSLDGYSFESKKTSFDHLFNRWEEELFEAIKDPFDEIKRNASHFPDLKIFSPIRIIEIGIYTLTLIFMILASVLPFELFSFFTKVTSPSNIYAGIIFGCAWSFLGIGIITLVGSILYSKKCMGFYVKARKKTFGELKDEQRKDVLSLKKYILNGIAKKEMLNQEIKKYSGISEYFLYLDYFSKMVQRKQLARDESFLLVEKISFILSLIATITFIVLLILKGVGAL